MTPHEAAKEYLARGWHPIPCFFPPESGGKYGKRPLVSWTRYQTEAPAPSDIDAWWRRWPQAGVGIVTGAATGIVVIDIDVGASDDDVASFHIPPTAVSVTPSGGRHVFLRHPGVKVKTVAGLKPRVDVRGDGGFTVLPPSVRPDGKRYEWLIDDGMAEIPTGLLSLVKDDGWKSAQRVDFASIVRGSHEGTRNADATKLIGLLCRYLPPRHWSSVAWPLVRAWNAQNNTPPDDEKKLLMTFNSIANAEMRRQKSL